MQNHYSLVKVSRRVSNRENSLIRKVFNNYFKFSQGLLNFDKRIMILHWILQVSSVGQSLWILSF